ncbi:MAG TPA: hypothetical protein VI893_06350 [Thermoplasmata archaeon]|nr:hypothetical protein [Thermoplasmata archaeon]
MPRPSVCPKCGSDHGALPCRSGRGPKDVMLQEVYSGRRSAVELSAETSGLNGAAPAKATLAGGGTTTIPAGTRAAAPAATAAAMRIADLRPEDYLGHSDPFVVALATQVIARNRLVDTMRAAAKTALDYTKERDAHLAAREVRIKEAAETLRRQRETIERREAILEAKMQELEQGRRDLTKKRFDFESEQRLAIETLASRMREIDSREREIATREAELARLTDKLAATRIDLDKMQGDRDQDLHSREERLADLEQGAKVRRLELEARLNRKLLAISGVRRSEEREPVAGDTTGPDGHSVGVIAATIDSPVLPSPVGSGAQPDPLEEVVQARAKLAEENERLSNWGKEIRRKESQLADAAMELAKREAKLAEMELRLERVSLERESTAR